MTQLHATAPLSSVADRFYRFAAGPNYLRRFRAIGEMPGLLLKSNFVACVLQRELSWRGGYAVEA
jgi:hypothetical protein